MMLKFKDKNGKVIMIEHDDGTMEYLDEALKKKAQEEKEEEK